MKDTVRMFVECIGIEEDCAQGTVEQALRLSVPQIVSVEKQDSKHGFVALVADEQGNHYKFGFGGLGYLEYIYSVERDTYLYFARG